MSTLSREMSLLSQTWQREVSTDRYKCGFAQVAETTAGAFELGKVGSHFWFLSEV